MADEKKWEDVGAIWENESKAGKKYMNILLNGTKYVAFQNNYKEGVEARPDWKIYPDKPKDGAPF